MTVAAALLGVATAQAQPTLAVTGTCPGPVTVQANAMTPGGRLTVFSGVAPGADPLPARSACPGTASGVSGLQVVAQVDDTDNDGAVQLAPTLPKGWCGRFVQVLDVATCSTVCDRNRSVEARPA